MVMVVVYGLTSRQGPHYDSLYPSFCPFPFTEEGKTLKDKRETTRDNRPIVRFGEPFTSLHQTSQGWNRHLFTIFFPHKP